MMTPLNVMDYNDCFVKGDGSSSDDGMQYLSESEQERKDRKLAVKKVQKQSTIQKSKPISFKVKASGKDK
jgi:hypothetical protein